MTGAFGLQAFSELRRNPWSDYELLSAMASGVPRKAGMLKMPAGTETARSEPPKIAGIGRSAES
jgi:hypothetical protein